MRWSPVPIVGGSYADDTRPWSHQDTVNWLPMRAERPGGRSTEMLRDVPGLFPFAQAGNGPIRGARDVEGRFFVVSGNKLYQIGADATATEIGTIPGGGLVSMAHNQLGLDGGNELIIGTVSSGYTYNVRTGSFSQITDPGFPGIQSVDFVGGHVVGIEPQRRYWLHSALADARSYNTTDIYSAEAAPDKLVGLLVLNGEVVVVGERTTEFFANQPTGTAAFQRVSGVSNDKGCASPHTLRRLDNSAFMLGSDGIVYRLDGYRWVRVSHHPLEQAIARSDISRALAYTYEDRGHAIYYLTLPDGQTWGFDVSQNEWARRESYGFDRWRINTLTRWNGGWYAGDFATGIIYRVDWDYHKEGAEPLVRTRRTAVLHDHGNRVFVHAVKINVDTGQPTGEGSVPAPTLTVSGDLPDGVVGDSGTLQYAVAGGGPPYVNYAITAGSLPPGATLNTETGLVTYAYTTSGNYSWTVTVTDTLGTTATVNDAAAVSSHVFFAVSSAYIEGTYARSPDGTDWSAALLESDPGDPGAAAHLCAAGGGKILLGSRISSDKGATWADSDNATGQANNRFIYADDVFLIAANASTIKRSADGITFTAILVPDVSGFGTDNLISISAKDGLMVACGYWPHLSVDGGLSWTSPTTTAVFTTSERTESLGTDGTTFVAGSQLGAMKRSTDGVAWASITSPFTGTPSVVAIAWANGIWVAGSDAGELAFSADGISWALAGSTLGGAVASILAAGDLFVAVGAGGKIATSTDGNVWTDRANSFGVSDIDDVTHYAEAP